MAITHQPEGRMHPDPKKIVFDDYADKYDEKMHEAIGFSGKSSEFFTEAKVRVIEELARKQPANIKVLDVGCGTGTTHNILQRSLRDLHGVDISPMILAKAKQLNPLIDYQCYSGNTLPYEDETFDIVYTICVLHHVPLDARPLFISEMRRVVKRSGIVVVFEHNPFNPLSRLVVSRCEFDKDAVLLAISEAKKLFAGNGLRIIEQKHILVFPFFSPMLGRVEKALSAFPFGAQYYVVGGKV